MMISLKEYIRQSLPGPTRQYREAKDRARSLLFRKTIVEHRYGGHKFRVHINDPVAKMWYDQDWDRPLELDLLAKYGLKKGALVFDLGAHQNVIAMMLAKDVTDTGKVISVEGAKHNASVGAANASLNNIGNITTINAVVSGKSEEIGFTQSFNGEVTNNSGGGLPSVTIDSLAEKFGNPSVVFMDIEGYELTALDGATEILRRGTTTWLIEVHGDQTLAKYGGRNRDVVDRFGSGYVFHYCVTEEEGFFPFSSPELTPKTRFWLLAAAPGTTE
jgi:FkbM family methyltransferase